MATIELYEVHHTGIDACSLGVRCEPDNGQERSSIPLRVEVPDGWCLGKSRGETVEMYDRHGRHAQLLLHLAHVQAITADGSTRLPIVWRANYDPVSGFALDPVSGARIE